MFGKQFNFCNFETYRNTKTNKAMTTTNYLQKKVKKEMIANGTISKIETRQAKHNHVAKSLGFNNAQEAFNAMGKDFLTIANK